MIKCIEGMDIDFLSNMKNMRSVISQISMYHGSNIGNKISIIDKQTNTFPGAAIVITICICTVCGLSLFLMSLLNTPDVYADNTNSPNSNLSSLVVTKQGTFIDANGKLNLVGVVDNIGHVPVQVNMGLNVKDTKTGHVTTMIQPTFSKVIYPLAGAPFKFVLDDYHNSSTNVASSTIPGKAYISSIKEVSVPYFKSLRLNYSNTPIGKDRSLVGTVKNIGPVDVHDVSVIASAHDNKTSQIDSVKSKPISVIKPGEEVPFTATPDPSEGPKILYYSCAEIDLHPGGMNTLDMGNGKTVAYDLHGIVSVSDFKYVSSTDSLVFAVKRWNPTGGPMSLKIVKASGAQDISVLMDGKMNNKDVSVKLMNPQTVHIDFNIPPGNHDIQVKGL
jgi:hypothetical protein